MKTGNKPPRHLRATGRAFWREIQSAYEIADPGGLKLLSVACIALDRMEEARAAIEEHGAFVLDRYGAPKANVACKVEHDAHNRFLASVRALSLDVEPLRDTLARGGPSPFQRSAAKSNATGTNSSTRPSPRIS